MSGAGEVVLGWIREGWDVIASIAPRAWTYWIHGNPGTTFGSILLLSVLTLGIDVATHGRWRRYFSHAAFTDVLYAVFYLAGFYAVLVLLPLRSLDPLADRYLGFLKLGLIEPWPLWLQFLVFTVLLDGVQYGQHRLMHAHRVLWSFHCIHHSAAHLTPFTKFRYHFVDMGVFSVIKIVPVLILGTPGLVWTAVNLSPVWLQALAHADLGWTFGPLEKVFASPSFHRLHHSTDPAECHRNFGFIFSFWDHLFGTAAESRARPLAYGCSDLHPGESFFGHLVFPFLLLARGRTLGASPELPARASVHPSPHP